MRNNKLIQVLWVENDPMIITSAFPIEAEMAGIKLSRVGRMLNLHWKKTTNGGMQSYWMQSAVTKKMMLIKPISFSIM